MGFILIKNESQIHGIRRSGAVAADVLRHVEPLVHPGITTAELNERAEAFIRAKGAIPAPLGYKGYPAATCISVNEVVCHGIPGARRLEEGDIVSVDVAVVLEGYYGDTCATYAVGAISEDAAGLIRVAKECLDIGVRQVRRGNYFGNIGYEIGRHAAAQNMGVVSAFCGHGCGIRFHEEPQVCHTAPANSGDMMLQGMIFTIEPMICLGTGDVYILNDGWTVITRDGNLSAQFEHQVLVTDSGCEILTA